jgi:hypothetical protein
VSHAAPRSMIADNLRNAQQECFACRLRDCV